MSNNVYENISDDIIFNLEIYHDNKDDINFINDNKKFYNMINQKELIINKINSTPEVYLKQKLFENIKYNKLKFINNDLNEINNEIIDKVFFVFDNGLLGDKSIEYVKRIFKNKLDYKIFIPFIYLCESSLNDKINNKYENIHEYLNKIIKDNKSHSIIYDDFYDNKILNKIYKLEADSIGFVYYNKMDNRLINYNCFSNSYSNIENIKNQINLLFEYIKKYSSQDNIKFYNKIKKLETLILEIDLEKDIKLNEKNNLFNKKYKEIKQLVLSLKASRDYYYIYEIQKIQLKYKDYKFIFVTRDEILASRFILNKISVICMDGLPKYFAYINDNTLILKQFNTLYKYIEDLNDDILNKIMYNNILHNTNLVLKNNKAIISKKIEILNGGRNINSEINKILDYDTEKNENKIISRNGISISYKMQSEKNNQITEIKNLIIEIEKYLDITVKIRLNNDFFKYISTKEYIDFKEKIRYYANKLYELNQKYTIEFIITNVNFDDDDKYEYINTSFINRLINYNGSNYEDYKKFYNKEITNIDGLLVGWLLSSIYYYDNDYLDYLKKYESIIPEYFEKYPLYEYYKVFYIYSIMNEEDKKKCKCYERCCCNN
jgi:hypothetical protein